MSKKSTYLLGILFTIIIGSLLYWWLCCKHINTAVESIDETTNEVIETKVKAPTFNPFGFIDNESDFKYSSKDNINFNWSNFNIADSVSVNVDNGILKLKNYLAENLNKYLNITGYYSSNETNNSAFPNLGLARANVVKNYLVSKGISTKQLNTYGKLNDEFYPDANNVLHGPVTFEILTKGEGDKGDEEALKALGDSIKAKPLVLYFKTGEASINLTSEQRQKIADISRYLDKVDDAACLVVGHTDNTGDRENNIVLGQERANFAKNYLIRNTIPESKITALSKGQDEPIADNSTEEGRAKNRRTVITLN